MLDQSHPDEPTAELAVAIARELLVRSRLLQTAEEKRQQAELDRMIQHPDDKATLVQWTDQAFRTQTPARVADQLTHILDVQGVPRFFSSLDQALLRGFQTFGGYLPGVAVPMVKNKMRRETANVILPAEDELLAEHLQARHREGIRMNVNFLGESLLGEVEAKRRLDHYSHSLRNPAIECISVKISTIYSQIASIGRAHSVKVLCDRMESLYRTAAHYRFRTADGASASKFVYLDMEEYRDLRLTADVLMRTLDRDGLSDVRAGIALQAYLPDSYGILEELVTWAAKRVALGGTPLTIRIVKGANLEMERVEAAIAGWPQAPYNNKLQTDANFKRMLGRLFAADAIQGIRIGVASHNLFDISLAMLWGDRAGQSDRIQFEMLEGMANHQRRAVFEATQSMLLYAPACRREDFLNAIGYLIRRLDENTGPANFLRHTFRLVPESDQWNLLADGFRESFAARANVSVLPRRTQNRADEPIQPTAATNWHDYRNEPDTDWALSVNVRWIESVLQSWQSRCGDQATMVPLVIGGESIECSQRRVGVSFDPSRPGIISCRFALAEAADIDAAAICAQSDPSGWRSSSIDHRHSILRAAAQEMRRRRGDLIGAAVADAGKTVPEADPEVSEAIDFTEFYPLTVKPFIAPENGSAVGREAIVVVSPWNFPIAIPCGGVAAALAAGNTVILKPSIDAVLPAYLICECFWQAGMPREALQFVVCDSVKMASRLASHDAIDSVILTGGTETARSILRAKPTLDLIAETGGKNATIVTSLADREQAIKHVLHSAFGHAGQKCSATSLLLLEQEVFEDDRFRDMLADAVTSLRVGSAWDLSTKIGPLIRPPRGDLARGLKELEGDESWLVLPEQDDTNPQLYRPGVKWNVSPGSFSHLTELFGPMLSVMPFRKLTEAIAIVNATGFGLTSGLESLDDREHEVWRESIAAGNLYINRSTTGAIVLRQPFGGIGKSSYGPGLKAGGPNYVLPLMKFSEPNQSPSPMYPPRNPLLAEMLRRCRVNASDESGARGYRIDAVRVQRVETAIKRFEEATETQYLRIDDPTKLLGQDNLRRYVPVSHLRIRLGRQDSIDDVLIAASAAVLTRCRAVFSYAGDPLVQELIDTLHHVTENWAGSIETISETDEELAAVIVGGGVDRLRVLGSTALSPTVQSACIEAFAPVVRQNVRAGLDIEPLWYLYEQSISHDYHRYGNLGRRSGEARRGPVGSFND